MDTKQIDALSRAFVAQLRNLLDANEWAEMQRRNARPEYRDTHSCASHDFLDANMVMADAFAQVVGREPDVDSGEDASLWSAAWAAAMPALTA